jgi:hypothetical protein
MSGFVIFGEPHIPTEAELTEWRKTLYSQPVCEVSNDIGSSFYRAHREADDASRKKERHELIEKLAQEKHNSVNTHHK